MYALNFGLCERYSIAFGRPRGFRQARLYFVERVFDYSAIVRQHLQENQEIKCSHCGSIFGFEQLDAIRMFAMRCPNCEKGTCEVVNLSKKYDKLLRDVDENLLLPGTELGILQTLHSEKRELYPAEIARELDCSHQLVGRRGRNLSQRKLIERRDAGNRRVYEITEEAERTYFPESKGAELQVE